MFFSLFNSHFNFLLINLRVNTTTFFLMTMSLAIFLQATDLKSHQSGKPTFFHGNGKDVSEIDYIFTKGAHSILQLPITVVDKPPHNLSDHTMLTGKLSITYRLRQKNLLSDHSCKTKLA